LIKEGLFNPEQILLSVCRISRNSKLLKEILKLADGNKVDEDG